MQKQSPAAILCLICLIGGMSAGCASSRAFEGRDLATHGDEIANIHFYLSRDTRISRLVKFSEKNISGEHAIRTYEKEDVVEIVVVRTMPGVLIGEEGDTLLVSFEPALAGRERYFRFVPEDELYVLATVPSKTKPPHEIVTYNGTEYRLGKYGKKWSAFSSHFTFYPQEKPHLRVRSKHIRELDKRTRELPGRELRDRSPSIQRID